MEERKKHSQNDISSENYVHPLNRFYDEHKLLNKDHDYMQSSYFYYINLFNIALLPYNIIIFGNLINH